MPSLPLRFESKTQKQSGNWQTSLKILGDGQGGTEDDSGVYTCTFVFSDEEKYEDISNIYFYSKWLFVELPFHFFSL